MFLVPETVNLAAPAAPPKSVAPPVTVLAPAGLITTVPGRVTSLATDPRSRSLFCVTELTTAAASLMPVAGPDTQQAAGQAAPPTHLPGTVPVRLHSPS